MSAESIKVGSHVEVFFGGVWSRNDNGHFFRSEGGGSADERRVLPRALHGWDGRLQPGIFIESDGHTNIHSLRTEQQIQGHVKMHYVDGWTAFCFWDRTADERGACNANFFAHARLDFNEMKALAAKRFPTIWKRFTFPFILVEVADHEPKPLAVLLFCPFCQQPHVDEEEMAARPHHVHVCLNTSCGKTFRLEPYCYGLPHPEPNQEIERYRIALEAVLSALPEDILKKAPRQNS